MLQSLAPVLFDDTEKEAAEAMRSSMVATALLSSAAVAKRTTGLTADGLPVHSFHSLLGRSRDLGAQYCQALHRLSRLARRPLQSAA
jgi:hypothetical protein